MAFEPERKYLVDLEQFTQYLSSDSINGEEKLLGYKDIMQAYLNKTGDWIAIISLSGLLTLKSEEHQEEFTYDLSKKDALQLFNYPTTTKLNYEQGLISPESWVSRVRVYDNKVAEVCLKERIAGDNRGECEAPSDIETAKVMFYSVKERIDKRRYFVMLDGYKWEVDVFGDLNEGLCIAELETEDKDYPLLSFIKAEITDEIRYYNDELSRNPYTQWEK